jgi:hypothetical protein
MFTRKVLALCMAAIVIVMATVGPVDALPTQVDYADDPNNCDPLFVPFDVHELGIAPTFSLFPDELIDAVDTSTNDVACFSSDDPLIPNTLVFMTNTTGIAWKDVWYVADTGDDPAVGALFTSISNFDGSVDVPGAIDRGLTFKIDTVGVNKPLISEDVLADGIFSPGETWGFIIDDYVNLFGIPASAFDSLGVASASIFGPPSSGSIIAVPVPEPATCLLLVIGLGAIATSRKRV